MAAAKKAADKQVITLHDHVKELRNRLFVVAIVFVGVSAIAYNYKDMLLYYLLKPLNGEQLIYLNPAGGFSFIFQVTMYVGMAVSVPFLVYNIYRFVAPALPSHARKHSFIVLTSSMLLLCTGALFGYIYAIPGALNFLNNFGEGYIVPTLTADSYLNFMLAYTAGLGILFQLPLVLLLIHWIYPLKPMDLFKFERYMILIAFVGAAMITPTPDVVNQTVIALPILIMYQIGVVAICISVYRAKRRARESKLSRSEQRHRRKADKLTGATKPVTQPVFPEIPDATYAAESTQQAAAQPKPVIQPQPVVPLAAQPKRATFKPDIVGPMKKQKLVTPTLPAVSSPPVAPAQTTPSQTRKSMDIMIATVEPDMRRRGTITRPDRPPHHRTPNLQVPRRRQTTDGIITSL